jgi:tetrahydromethanopterin S-methyltransferase subunit A
LPGQSLQSLFENGVDELRRIRGARGKRPVLKNVSIEEIQAFVEQVELIPMIGEERNTVIGEQVEASGTRDTGPYVAEPDGTKIGVIQAAEPDQLTLDKTGYFVVYPDRRKRRLVLERYTNAGVLDCVIEGMSGSTLCTEAIRRHLLERLDHAAYLGRELARAERTLDTGEPYVQDKAPGRLAGEYSADTCECTRQSGTEGELK